MKHSACIVALYTGLAVAYGQDDIQAEIDALQNKLHEQQELIKGQTQRLIELDQFDQEAGRRLQTTVTPSEATTKFNSLMNDAYSMSGAMDSFWLCLCGVLVMFMHAGFSMLETGCCRAKNASNVLMNLVNVCVGTLGWFLLGWGLAYGKQEGTDFFGTNQFAGQGFYTRDGSGNIMPYEGSCDASGCISTMLRWFFQWAFCTAAATIVSGAVAERVKAPAFGFFAFVMTTLIYPLVVAPSWGGGWGMTYLTYGIYDFAGSGIVHFTGGVAGLAGTWVLGPRKGRFETPEAFECHHLPMVVLGTFALWFGWYGFNPGSTLAMNDGDTGALAAQVAMNTTLSAATGGITVFMLRYFLLKKYDVPGLCNGILAGLVSITAGCANVECGSAFVIGLMGGIVYQGASMLIQKFKIDDPVDASPVHGFCGLWGVLAAALFDWGKDMDHFHGGSWSCVTGADTNCARDNVGLAVLWNNIIMIICIIVWSGASATVTFLVLKWCGGLRIDEETEDMGMDAKSHSPPKAYALT